MSIKMIVKFFRGSRVEMFGRQIFFFFFYKFAAINKFSKQLCQSDASDRASKGLQKSVQGDKSIVKDDTAVIFFLICFSRSTLF